MSKNDNTTETQRCITPEFRVSYPHLFKPAQVQGKGDAKYSITMLFKKTQDLATLKLAMKHAKLAEWPKGNFPKDLMSPVSDGDHEKYADKEGYVGHWVVKATSNAENKPGVVDETGKTLITDPALLYPGCYARAVVFARVWEYMGKQGVHLVLDHVQKTREGQSFAGRKSALEVFDPIGSAEENLDDSDDRSDSF